MSAFEGLYACTNDDFGYTRGMKKHEASEEESCGFTAGQAAFWVFYGLQGHSGQCLTAWAPSLSGWIFSPWKQSLLQTRECMPSLKS